MSHFLRHILTLRFPVAEIAFINMPRKKPVHIARRDHRVMRVGATLYNLEFQSLIPTLYDHPTCFRYFPFATVRTERSEG
jgi:hypothetical protein